MFFLVLLLDPLITLCQFITLFAVMVIDLRTDNWWNMLECPDASLLTNPITGLFWEDKRDGVHFTTPIWSGVETANSWFGMRTVYHKKKNTTFVWELLYYLQNIRRSLSSLFYFSFIWDHLKNSCEACLLIVASSFYQDSSFCTARERTSCVVSL